MKLHEIVDDQDADVFHVHSGADIMGALKASLMHDWIIVDIEPHPDEVVDRYKAKLIDAAKKITKIKPKWAGWVLTINVYSSEELKKLLDSFNDIMGPGEWPWAASITNWDFDT